MGAVVSCIQSVFRAIGQCIMAVVNAIGSILMAIVNGIVAVFDIIISAYSSFFASSYNFGEELLTIYKAASPVRVSEGAESVPRVRCSRAGEGADDTDDGMNGSACWVIDGLLDLSTRR